MATLKSKAKVTENESENLMEKAVSQDFNFTDDESVFEMLAGYKDKDDVIHREFTLREMTGKDEEAIHKSDVKSNGSKVVSVLLSRCVTRIGTLTPKSLGKQKWEELIKSLFTGDQDYMLIQLRKLSIGEEIELNHVCPNKDCKAKLNTVLNVDELEVVPFSGEREIEFELPRGYKDRKGVLHKTGTLRLPTGLDREVLTPLAKTNLAKAETVMLTRLCKFDDGAYVDDDVMSSLSIRDREYLQKLLQEHYFGVKLETEITCDSCGESFMGSFNASNFI